MPWRASATRKTWAAFSEPSSSGATAIRPTPFWKFRTAATELTYEAADGVHSEGGGGVAIDAFGRERPLTEEELLEDLQNRIDVTYREDGTVWVYYKDQSMEITDLFDENGVCFVQLKDGKKTVYLTVEYDSCFSWSTECYLQPTQRHS